MKASKYHCVDGKNCGTCNNTDNNTVIGGIRKLIQYHDEYQNAIEIAQTMYHNYEEWTKEEYEPINDATHHFYTTVDKLSELLGEKL